MISPTADKLLERIRRRGWTSIDVWLAEGDSSQRSRNKNEKYCVIIEREKPEYDVIEHYGTTSLAAIRAVYDEMIEKAAEAKRFRASLRFAVRAGV